MKKKPIPKTPKVSTGRSIGQNIAVTRQIVERATLHDSIVSGGIR